MRIDGRLALSARRLILRALRERGLDAKDLAERIGIDPATLSRWLKCSGSGLDLTSLQRLSAETGLTPDLLLLEVEELPLSRRREVLTLVQDMLAQVANQEADELAFREPPVVGEQVRGRTGPSRDESG